MWTVTPEDMQDWEDGTAYGDAEAAYNVGLGIAYSDQRKVLTEEDGKKAVQYLTYAFENGLSEAGLDIGGMYVSGRGVERSREKALEWYLKAHDADPMEPTAYRCLGNFYLYRDDGSSVTKSTDPEDIRISGEYFRKGAELGNQNCLYEWGDRLYDGIGVEQDRKEAFHLYRKAYDIIQETYDWEENIYKKDDSWADVCFRLGRAYHRGEGTEKNLVRAKTFLEEAKAGSDRRIAENDYWGAIGREDLLAELAMVEAEDGNERK